VNTWAGEPLWQWWDGMLSPAKISAADVLCVRVLEFAHHRPHTCQTYKGLDSLRSRLRQGEPGVIVRLYPRSAP
jgi:hypothetical protein